MTSSNFIPGDPFSRRHRKPRGRFGRIARAAAAAVAVAVGALTAGATIASGLAVATTDAGTPWIGLQAVTVTQAAAQLPIRASLESHRRPAADWTDETCHAFSDYRTHQTAANLARLVISATHLGRSYLRADVAQLWADASSPSAKAAGYTDNDVTYLYADCNGGAGI